MKKHILVLLTLIMAGQTLFGRYGGGGYHGGGRGGFHGGYRGGYGRGYGGGWGGYGWGLGTGLVVGSALSSSDSPKSDAYYDMKDRENQRRSLRDQIKQNRTLLRKAQRQGDKAEVARLKSEIADLQEQLSSI